MDDGDVLPVGFFRQHRAHQARICHEAINVLMMLVRADAVKARLGGEQQFVEREIVVLANLFGIGNVKPDWIDERGVITLLEIRRQVPIRHQVEHADFHGRASRFCPACYGAKSCVTSTRMPGFRTRDMQEADVPDFSRSAVLPGSLIFSAQLLRAAAR